MSSMNMKSSRKYAVNTSSPLARESTTTVMRLKKKDSFSSAQHTHGLGGEAKDAMLRPGLRMRRTNSSLRVIATKGNATLTAAISHKVFVPELEIFLKNYTRKEDEFAESIPSAMCPFQFIQNDTSDILPFQRKSSSGDVKEVKAEADPQQMREWLKDMRLKVHMRVVQRQQVTSKTTPTEGYKMGSDKRLNETTKGQDSDRKKDSDKKKGSETDRKKGSESERKKSDGDKKKGSETDRKKDDKKRASDGYDAIEPPSSVRSEGRSKDKEDSPKKKESKSSRKIKRQGKPVAQPLSKVSSHGPATTESIMDTSQPLFQARKNPTLGRRIHSEYDVRRVRLKARNSVGFEPAW